MQTRDINKLKMIGKEKISDRRNLKVTELIQIREEAFKSEDPFYTAVGTAFYVGYAIGANLK